MWDADLASMLHESKLTVRDAGCEQLLKLLAAKPEQLERLLFVLSRATVFRRHVRLVRAADVKRRQVTKLGGKAKHRTVPKVRCANRSSVSLGHVDCARSGHRSLQLAWAARLHHSSRLAYMCRVPRRIAASMRAGDGPLAMDPAAAMHVVATASPLADVHGWQ